MNVAIASAFLCGPLAGGGEHDPVRGGRRCDRSSRGLVGGRGLDRCSRAGRSRERRVELDLSVFAPRAAVGVGVFVVVWLVTGWPTAAAVAGRRWR